MTREWCRQQARLSNRPTHVFRADLSITSPARLALVREVARSRKPSYLEITAVLAAVGAIGTWFGAMLL